MVIDHRPYGPLVAVQAVVSLCLMIGCEGPKRDGATASGNVTVNGSPLSGAVITFEPSGETVGSNASAPIFDGQFVIGNEAGLSGGQYRIRISMIPAELRRTLPAKQRAGLPPEDAVIDPRFDANSDQNCELRQGQENRFEFKVDFL